MKMLKGLIVLLGLYIEIDKTGRYTVHNTHQILMIGLHYKTSTLVR